MLQKHKVIVLFLFVSTAFTSCFTMELKKIKTIKCGLDVVKSIAFSPDGAKIAAGGRLANEGGIQILDAKKGQEIGTSLVKPGVNSVAFDPDGTKIAAGVSGSR